MVVRFFAKRFGGWLSVRPFCRGAGVAGDGCLAGWFVRHG